MTWTPIPSDERTKLKVEDSDVIRAVCACGCMKFAVVVTPGENRIDREALEKVTASVADSFRKLDIVALPRNSFKTQWQLVCLNCKQRHV